MDVKGLIAMLRTFPADADVMCVWDGGPRTYLQIAWLSRGGLVLLADDGDVVYDAEDRPAFAPNEKDDPYWKITSSAVQNAAPLAGDSAVSGQEMGDEIDGSDPSQPAP